MAVAANGLDEAKSVAEHLHVVKSIARRFATVGIPLKDLEQEGAIGLLMAVRNWDPAGASLWTYANFVITKHIKRAIGETEDGDLVPDVSIVSRPRTSAQKAEDASWDISMDAFRGDTSNTLHDVFASEAQTPEQLYIEAEERHFLAQAIERLGERDREIIRLGLAGRTLHEMGEVLGLCKARCQQIDARAKSALANSIRAQVA